MKQEPDAALNLQKAGEKVREAVDRYHPDLMLFPEMFMSLFPKGTDRATRLGSAQTLDGAFVSGMRKLAKDNHLWIVFGMNEKVEDPDDDRNYNCTVMVNADGEIVATYRKTHMYDAFGMKESADNKPGDRLFEPVDTPFGKIGLFVCYEVRFPEIARYQRERGTNIWQSLTRCIWMNRKTHSCGQRSSEGDTMGEFTFKKAVLCGALGTVAMISGIAIKYCMVPAASQPEPQHTHTSDLSRESGTAYTQQAGVPHVTIHSEEIITEYEIPFREEEIDLMARVVQAEYGNGDETDQRLIVSVILNRMEDPDFPGTIYGVITQPNQFAIAQWASVESMSSVYKEIKDRTDREILWFCAGGYPKWGVPAFERNSHYFSRKKREGER